MTNMMTQHVLLARFCTRPTEHLIFLHHVGARDLQTATNRASTACFRRAFVSQLIYPFVFGFKIYLMTAEM